MTETTYTATFEAHRIWSRLTRLLRAWWFEDRADFAHRRWHDGLGVRVSGLGADPLELVVVAISGEAALENLRLVNVKAFHLLMAKLEHPMDAWFNSRGTGIAQVVGLEKVEATSLYEAGVEYVSAYMKGEPLVGAPMQVLRR